MGMGRAPAVMVGAVGRVVMMIVSMTVIVVVIVTMVVAVVVVVVMGMPVPAFDLKVPQGTAAYSAHQSTSISLIRSSSPPVICIW